MKNSIKIFIFLFVLAVGIFLLRPWETSDKLAVDGHQSQMVTPHKAGKTRAPASVGNPGEASAMSVRE